MGCFNKIGFISSLPILMGDECVLILMRDKKSYKEDIKGGTVHPTDIFSPVFLPIFGKYNDYGNIEDITKSTITEYIEEFFDSDIETILQDIDDMAVGRGSDSNITKNIEFLNTLTFGLEHKFVYDRLVNEFKKIQTYNDKDFTDDTMITYIHRAELKINGTGFRDNRFEEIMSKKLGIEYVNEDLKFIQKIGSKSILEFLSFNRGINELNSKYFPSNYGSQCQDFVLHYKMLTDYRNLVVRKIKEYDDCDDMINQLKDEVRDERLTDILSK